MPRSKERRDSKSIGINCLCGLYDRGPGISHIEASTEWDIHMLYSLVYTPFKLLNLSVSGHESGIFRSRRGRKS